MDSFEQYGELMNQWDSASPPGDRHRRTFDKALMGMEMCGGGGGQSQSDDNYMTERTFKYNQRVAEHSIKEGHAKVEQARETVRLQRANQQRQMQFQDLGRYKDWNKANIIQGWQQKAQRDAYNKSKFIHEQQLGLNKQAAKGATSGAHNRRYERELELEFNKRKTNLEAYGSKLKLDTFRKEAAFQGAANFLEGIQNIGAVSNNTGRSAVKEKISAISQTAGKAAALSEQINSAESLFNLELLGADTDRLAHQETGLSIERIWHAEIEKIGHSYLQANLQADAKLMAKPQMLPPISKPEALPRQEFQDPRPYVRGPLPVPGVGYSAAGGGGGGGGGGVGAAMTTLGGMAAALPTAGSAGAAALGFSVGAAVPVIGTAIAGIGAIGMAFDWW